MSSGIVLQDNSFVLEKCNLSLYRFNRNIFFLISALWLILFAPFIGVDGLNSEKDSIIISTHNNDTRVLNETTATDSDSITGAFTILNGALTFDGYTKYNQTKGLPGTFPGFSIVKDPSALIAIELKNVKIDGRSFSKSLQPFINLESITLENLTISNDFNYSVYLPKLKEFTLNQIIQPGESSSMYNTLEKLRSNIFFTKTEGREWDLIEIINSGIQLSIKAGSTKLIGLNRSKKEIMLNVPFCNDILKNINYTYEILSLSRCNISKSVIPVNLRYINLSGVGVTDGTLSDIIKSFTRLTDFIASIDGTTVNLSDFPSSLNFFSISSMNITFNPDYVSTNMTDVSVGSAILPSKLIEKFDVIFPRVKRVAIFGLEQDEKTYKLLYNVLNTNATWIVMEGFQRKSESQDTIVQMIESYLKTIGVPDGDTNFLVTCQDMSDERVGMSLFTYQNDFYKFNLLGWYKFKTFEAFQKSNNI